MAQNGFSMSAPEDRVPFDETAVTHSRRRCFFCEAEKSDEWKFLPRLNAFVCQSCQERVEKTAPDEERAG